MNSLRFELGRDRSLLALFAAAALSLCVVFAGAAEAAPDTATAAAKKKCGKKKGKKAVSAAKKCGKKKKDSGSGPVTPIATPAPPTPAPLTAAEVINQVNLKAAQYCDEDPDCLDSGYYFDTAPGDPACEYRTTYTWACLGWNDEDFENDDEIIDTTCDFLEIVQRVGLNGVSSSQDLTYAGDGWDCFPFDP
jgi:hypothetical protein